MILFSIALMALAGEPVELTTPPTETVQLQFSFGIQCERSERINAEALRARLDAAGVEVLALEQMMVCSACGCPGDSYMLTVSASQEEAAKVAATTELTETKPAAKPTTYKLTYGRQCTGPEEGVPGTGAEAVEALRTAGIDVYSYEILMTCRSCSCAKISVAVVVPADQLEQVQRISDTWDPIGNLKP